MMMGGGLVGYWENWGWTVVQKFQVSSTFKILHDLSSDRRQPDRFLSTII